jgi:phage terminase large subunit-like protein
MRVLSGLEKDDSFLAVIYGAEHNDDWKSEATWKKANPGYGISIKPSFFLDECKKAQASLAAQNTFRRLYLNQWTEQDTRWLDMDLWAQERCMAPIVATAMYKQPCWCGLDLSTTTDLSAFAAVFAPDDECDMWRVLMKFWMPRDTLQKRAREDRAPYVEWAQAGLITVTSGNAVDYGQIIADICDFADKHEVREIAFDPWNATMMSQQLMSEGLNMVEFRQGYRSMSPACKELEGMLAKGTLQHGNHAVLTRHAMNAVTEQDPAGNIKVAKNKATERIDGIVALVMALGRATLLFAQKPVKSVYEERGFLIL